MISIPVSFSQDTTECGGEIDSISGLCVYTIVDEMPEYPGGFKEMVKFIQKIELKEVSYSEFNNSSISFGFIVEKDGKVSFPRLLKREGNAYTKLFLAEIEKMPLWKPGKQRGEVVNVFVLVPIRIHLK